MDESLLGAEVSRRVWRLRGSWQEVADAAEKMYGKRGRILAILHRPISMQWSVSACESLLREAGFKSSRILGITHQKPTVKGFRVAIRMTRTLLEQDVCPDYLKSGRCACESCALRHKIN